MAATDVTNPNLELKMYGPGAPAKPDHESGLELESAVDPVTGRTTKLLTEKDDAWVNLDQAVPRWLEGGKAFVWLSESLGGPALERRSV